MSTTAEQLENMAGKLGALEVAVAKQTTICEMCQPRILGNGKSYGDRLTELETTAKNSARSRTKLDTAKITGAYAIAVAGIGCVSSLGTAVLQWLF